MNILDRMLLVTFLRGFVICFGCTMSLYIIVDMFTNLDDFGAKANGFLDVIMNILNYYGYRIAMYYDRLCEAIALLAAMFTIAWMQRSNELLPILSAGVSTHRVLRPILFGAVLVLTLGILNQELLIPRIAHVLMLERDDPDGDREVMVQGAFDPNGVHIEGKQAVRKEMRIKEIYITLPELPRTPMLHLTAPTATYIPPGSDSLSGGWLLKDAVPAQVDPDNRPSMLIAGGEPGKYFVKTREVTFETVTRNPKWFNFASATQLHYLLDHTERRAADGSRRHLSHENHPVGGRHGPGDDRSGDHLAGPDPARLHQLGPVPGDVSALLPRGLHLQVSGQRGLSLPSPGGLDAGVHIHAVHDRAL